MVNLLEVNTTWTPPSGISTKSVMYFGPGATPAFVRLSIQEMWEALVSALSTTTTWSIDTDGRILDSATGTLLGAWTDPEVLTGAGTDAGQPVPDASQVLMRWSTGSVVAGRFLQGRTFVPGLSNSETEGGNLGAGTRTTFVNAQAGFLLALAGQFGVWHRPKNKAGGVFVSATGGTTAAELAVLRRRRNPM